MTLPASSPDERPVPSFERGRVVDAMHPGVLTCPRETPLRTVARMMASYRVHCVVVLDQRTEADDMGSLWGVVSDLDLVGALAAGDVEDRTAGGTAATPVVMVSPDETLVRAAQLMTEHGTAHLVVVDRTSRLPLGVLSTLDLARVAAAERPV